MNVIDSLFEDLLAIKNYLDRQGETSLSLDFSVSATKVLLLACASHYEHIITDSVARFTADSTTNNDRICGLVQAKAISRQYHTYFNWKENNANQFFGLFGEDFKAKMIQRVKDDEDFDKSIKAFLELGRERNRLVHQDFATYSVEKTLEEVKSMHDIALPFAAGVYDLLRN